MVNIKFLNTLSVDLKRCFTSYGFYIGIFATILAFLFSNSGEFWASSSGSLYLFNYAFIHNNATGLFVLISTMAYATAFCTDYNTKAIYYYVSRNKKISGYTSSKCMSAALMGGLSVTIGAILFLLYASLVTGNLLPADGYRSGFPGGGFESLLENNQLVLYFICLFSNIFFQSAFWSVVGLYASSFLTNKYIAILVPFISSYILIRIMNILDAPQWARFILGGIQISQYSPEVTWTIMVAEYSILIILLSILFHINVKRRIINA